MSLAICRKLKNEQDAADAWRQRRPRNGSLYKAKPADSRGTGQHTVNESLMAEAARIADATPVAHRCPAAKERKRESNGLDRDASYRAFQPVGMHASNAADRKIPTVIDAFRRAEFNI